MVGARARRHEDVLAILRAGIAGADAAACVTRHLQRVGDRLLRIGDETLAVSENVHAVVAGKAATAMATALRGILDGLPGERLVMAPATAPSDRAVAARVGVILDGAGVDDLVLVALSGGASALLGDAAQGLDAAEVAEAATVLQRAGARIDELNVVRKHLATLKGGLATVRAFPARVRALVLSDVVGSPLDVIACGPTVADPSTYGDALAIVERLGLAESIPRRVLARLREGVAGRIEETAKAGDPRLRKARTLLIGDNRLALAAAAAEARVRGYRVHVATAALTGEARLAGERLGKLAARFAGRRGLGADTCLLAGGETTVTVHGHGRGGRNQEMVLAAARYLDGSSDVCFASLGTDGIDGTSDAAGAWADGNTVAEGAEAGVDAIACLETNDSHEFFRRVGSAIVTGPTGTNVMDLQVLLMGAR